MKALALGSLCVLMVGCHQQSGSPYKDLDISIKPNQAYRDAQARGRAEKLARAAAQPVEAGPPPRVFHVGDIVQIPTVGPGRIVAVGPEVLQVRFQIGKLFSVAPIFPDEIE